MPRKSATLRLSQATELYAAYQKASIEEVKTGRFIRDMIARLQGGRGLSKGQRNWLDSLIEEGVPQPKGDQVLLSKIDSAISTLGMESKIDVLNDFRRKVYNGWDLSPKQAKWLSGMLAQAKDFRTNGCWAPSENQVKDMKDIANLSRGYSSIYWQSHGGTYRAVEKIREYLHLLEVELTSENAEHREVALAKVGLDEWCINKAKKAMAGKFRELREKPYAKVGTLVWTQYRPEGAIIHQWFQAPVCGAPEVSPNGTVVYPVLNPARGLILVTKEQIAKRKPKGA